MSKNGANSERQSDAEQQYNTEQATMGQQEEVSQQAPDKETAQPGNRHEADQEIGTSARNENIQDENIQEEMIRLREELSDVNNKLLRQAAEYQNYRRRTEREKTTMMEFGQRQVVIDVLEVLDDFQRSLQAADQVEAEQEGKTDPAYASLREGVELVYQKFLGKLEKLGVEPIEAVGEPFDEQLHEAVMQLPAPEDEDKGIVLEEVQRGYVLGDRVLRHSKVVVGT